MHALPRNTRQIRTNISSEWSALCRGFGQRDECARPHHVLPSTTAADIFQGEIACPCRLNGLDSVSGNQIRWIPATQLRQTASSIASTATADRSPLCRHAKRARDEPTKFSGIDHRAKSSAKDYAGFADHLAEDGNASALGLA